MTPEPATSTPPPAMRAYVAKLEAFLQPLPAQARSEIIREITSHLTERHAQGNLEEALAALGEPDHFARSFVEDFDLQNALNRAAPWSLLISILGRGARSTLALASGFVAVCLYMFCAAFAAIAVLKPITPHDVGVWRTATGFDFGAIYGTAHPQSELVGYWIIPIGLLCALLAYLAATEILRASGRLLLRSGQGSTAH